MNELNQGQVKIILETIGNYKKNTKSVNTESILNYALFSRDGIFLYGSVKNYYVKDFLYVKIPFTFENEFIVHIKKLENILKLWKTSKSIKISVNSENDISLINGSKKRILKTDSFGLFDFNKLEEMEFVGLNKETYDTYKKCLYCISNDETRYFMNGVNINNKHIVSTDGRRLHLIENENNISYDIIVPEIKLKSCYAMGCNEKYTYFDSEGIIYYMPNISGQFPNYLRVIPEKQEHFKTINNDLKKEMLEAIKEHVSINKLEKIVSNRIEFLYDKIVSGGYENIFNENIFKLEFAFNASYFLEEIEKYENLIISYTGNNNAVTFKNDNENKEFSIVMPMQWD